MHTILVFLAILYAFAYYNCQAMPLLNKIFVKLYPYKLVLSELFQQKCEKSFQKILPR